MNTLSWLIYLAQVLSSLGELFIFFGASILFGVAAYGVATAIASCEDEEFHLRIAPARYVWLAAICLFLGNITPTKDTVYAIAASEVGDKMLKSELATDATKALQQWIKNQIEPPAKK